MFRNDISEVVFSRQMMKSQLEHAILEEQAEVTFLRQAKAGDREAVDSLVRHNQKLVRMVALNYFNTGMCGDQELEDVCQWGNMGLLQAIKKWDEALGSRFSTYAYWWIRAFVRRWGIMKGTGLTISFRTSDMVTAIRKARAQLTEALQREPTVKEVALKAGVAERDVNAVTAIMTNMSRLDVPIEGNNTPHSTERRDKFAFDEDVALRDLLAQSDQENLEDTAIDNVLMDKVMREIEGMPSNLRTVILHRFGLDGHAFMTYEKLGRRMQVSPTTIQNTEKEAIRHLRGRLMVSVQP